MELKKNSLNKSNSIKCLGCQAKTISAQSLRRSSGKEKRSKQTCTNTPHHCQRQNSSEPIAQAKIRPKTSIQLNMIDRPQTPTIDKQSVVIRRIVADNSQYFIDKTKVCCSVKPSDQRLQLPSKMGHTMYMHDFTRKLSSDTSVKMNKMEPYRAKYPFMDMTNYKSNYVRHPLTINKGNDRQKIIKDDAPRFLQTQYNGDFKNWGGSSNNMKVQPQENYVFGGGCFDGKTIYNTEFVPKEPSPISQANFKENNTKQIVALFSHMFLDMNVPVTSNYRNEFTKKKALMENNCKPKNVYVPTISNQSAYNSEYKKMYDPKQHDHCHYRKVMSVKELQDLISKK